VDVFALVALIVSAIALVVSGLSAWYTRREARAAEGVLELDQKRELSLSRPAVVVSFNGLPSSRDVEFVLKNQGAHSVDSADFKSLSEHDGIGFIPRRYDRTPAKAEHTFGPLQPGETLKMDFCVAPNYKNRLDNIKLLATYRRSSDEWKELLELPIPPDTGGV
jgi:hypothetical protein